MLNYYNKKSFVDGFIVHVVCCMVPKNGYRSKDFNKIQASEMEAFSIQTRMHLRG